MINSIRKNKLGISLMLVSSMCVCIGQLCWKIAYQESSLFLLAGFLLYGLGALSMIKAYSFGKLSILQPVLSMNYVFSFIIGYFILKEYFTFLKVVGVIIIITGVLFIGGSDDE